MNPFVPFLIASISITLSAGDSDYLIVGGANFRDPVVRQSIASDVLKWTLSLKKTIPTLTPTQIKWLDNQRSEIDNMDESTAKITRIKTLNNGTIASLDCIHKNLNNLENALLFLKNPDEKNSSRIAAYPETSMINREMIAWGFVSYYFQDPKPWRYSFRNLIANGRIPKNSREQLQVDPDDLQRKGANILEYMVFAHLLKSF